MILTDSKEYRQLHHTVRKIFGPAREWSCSSCSNPAMDWACVGDYRSVDTDYQPMCRACHMELDGYRGFKVGSDNYSARIAEQDVPHIRELLAYGFTLDTVSKMYSVGTSTIQDIKKNRTWRHI